MNFVDILGDTDQGVIAFKIENGIFKIIPGILSDQPVTFNDADFDKIAPPTDDKCAYNHGPTRDYPIVSKDLGSDYNMYQDPRGPPIEANLKVEEMKNFMPDLYDYYRCQKGRAEEERKRQADLISQAAQERQRELVALERRKQELAAAEQKQQELKALAQQELERRMREEEQIRQEMEEQERQTRLAEEERSRVEALMLAEERKKQEAVDEEKRRLQELERLALENKRKEEEKLRRQIEEERRQQISILESKRAEMENQFRYFLDYAYSVLLKDLFKDSRTVISLLRPDIFNQEIVRDTKQMNRRERLNITDPRMQKFINNFSRSYKSYKETFLKIEKLYDLFTRDTNTMTLEEIKTAIREINISNMKVVPKTIVGIKSIQELFEGLPDITGIYDNESNVKELEERHLINLIRKILKSDPKTATPIKNTTVRRRGGDRHNKTLRARLF
jgi:hypothetical protein